MTSRIIASLLALLMTFSLAACSGSGDPAADTIPIDTTTPETQETATATEPVFQEIVLCDDENVTVKVTAIKPDDLMGYTMKLYLENKTDSDLTFTLDGVSVNGFMCDPFWAATVTPGMKANEDVTFLSSSLESCNIDTVTAIEFTLRVYPADDFTAEDLLEQVCTIYPLGKDAVESWSRTPVDGEIVLFDNEYATMIIEGTEEDSIWGYALNVYLENKTDKTLMFSADGVAVNGFMCDPYWAVEVAPGKRCITDISWFTETFEESGITQVDSIVIPVTVGDADDWMADDLISETFTIEP